MVSVPNVFGVLWSYIKASWKYKRGVCVDWGTIIRHRSSGLSPAQAGRKTPESKCNFARTPLCKENYHLNSLSVCLTLSHRLSELIHFRSCWPELGTAGFWVNSIRGSFEYSPPYEQFSEIIYLLFLWFSFQNFIEDWAFWAKKYPCEILIQDFDIIKSWFEIHSRSWEFPIILNIFWFIWNEFLKNYTNDFGKISFLGKKVRKPRYKLMAKFFWFCRNSLKLFLLI